jgi:hypothetical protein
VKGHAMRGMDGLGVAFDTKGSLFDQSEQKLLSNVLDLEFHNNQKIE